MLMLEPLIRLAFYLCVASCGNGSLQSFRCTPLSSIVTRLYSLAQYSKVQASTPDPEMGV